MEGEGETNGWTCRRYFLGEPDLPKNKSFDFPNLGRSVSDYLTIFWGFRTERTVFRGGIPNDRIFVNKRFFGP